MAVAFLFHNLQRLCHKFWWQKYFPYRPNRRPNTTSHDRLKAAVSSSKEIRNYVSICFMLRHFFHPFAREVVQLPRFPCISRQRIGFKKCSTAMEDFMHKFLPAIGVTYCHMVSNGVIWCHRTPDTFWCYDRLETVVRPALWWPWCRQHPWRPADAMIKVKRS